MFACLIDAVAVAAGEERVLHLACHCYRSCYWNTYSLAFWYVALYGVPLAVLAFACPIDAVAVAVAAAAGEESALALSATAHLLLLVEEHVARQLLGWSGTLQVPIQRSTIKYCFVIS